MADLKYQNPATTDAVLDSRVTDYGDLSTPQTRREVVEASSVVDRLDQIYKVLQEMRDLLKLAIK